MTTETFTRVSAEDIAAYLAHPASVASEQITCEIVVPSFKAIRRVFADCLEAKDYAGAQDALDVVSLYYKAEETFMATLLAYRIEHCA